MALVHVTPSRLEVKLKQLIPLINAKNKKELSNI
jgi:hypothetical protein